MHSRTILLSLVILVWTGSISVSGSPYIKPKVQNISYVPHLKCTDVTSQPTNTSEGIGECGNGLCTRPSGKVENECVCLEPYMSMKDYNEKTTKASPCTYFAAKKKTAFLYSLFLGALGADWFYLSRCCAKRALVSQVNRGYICMGFFKFFTMGGLGLWWFIDILLIAFDVFPDGNGMPLWNDL